MKNYDIEAYTTGYSAKIDVTDGELKACLLQAGGIKRITVTGRGNVRQIKTIAKTFYNVLKGEP
ncbi:TPA: hypothetical protein U2I30_003744 [Providencia rettgeri]|nr:hypothetical protein [Providencia rettgeri]HCR4096406.1 hypothetical protein [Providencia rettgeri]HEM6892264.1 hypothetical protein [Providencia rettgeri]